MEKKLFLLEPHDSSRIMRIFQIILGILCIIVALFWLIFNFKTFLTDKTLWITVVFLLGFGLYQIMAGFGKTSKYIETGAEKIVLKQNSFLPMIELKPADLQRIEFFPLSICFLFKNGKKIVHRFGLTNTDIIVPVKESIIEFAKLNKIPYELMKEEL